jgi:hypothetical protein
LSISNYGELKTAVANYLNRSDLTSYIPDFILQGQTRIHYGSDEPYSSVPLRIPAMQQRASGSLSSSAIAFPTRFLEVIRLVGVSGTIRWSIDFESTTAVKNSSNADYPSYYAFRNNQIEVSPYGQADYVLDYYQGFAAFSADGDTDWLLTNHPSVYLFAALIESAPFLGDQTMIPAWVGFYRSQISSLNRVAKKGTNLYVRAA